MSGWKSYKGKKAKIVFDDFNKVSVSIGTIKEINDHCLFVEESTKEVAISFSRLIRIELLESDIRKNKTELE